MMWLAGAPLTPFCKRDGGVHPVAVGETLRRIVSYLFMRRVSHSAQAFLEPLQVGVSTRGGTEAIVHASRRLIEEKGRDKSYGLLQIDLKKLFNLVNRQAILSVVRREFPDLLHWVNLCYNSVNPLIWTG